MTSCVLTQEGIRESQIELNIFSCTHDEAYPQKYSGTKETSVIRQDIVVVVVAVVVVGVVVVVVVVVILYTVRKLTGTLH